jgi:DNA primase
MYQQIKATLSIIDVAKKNGIKVSKNNKSLCPFHGDTKTPNLSFKGNIFKCFACDAKGDMFTLVSKLYQVTNREALDIICNQFNVTNVKTNKAVRCMYISLTYNKEEELKEELIRLEQIYFDTWKYLKQNKPILGEEIDEIIINMSSYLIELEKSINNLESRLYNLRRS